MSKHARRWSTLLACAALAGAAQAGEVELTAPEEVGLSSERLDRFTDHLERLVDEESTGGFQVLVSRHGSGSARVADPDLGARVRADSSRRQPAGFRHAAVCRDHGPGAVIDSPLCAAAGAVASTSRFNMFDMDSVIMLEGRVTEFRRVNPHGYITVETTNEQSETVVWEIETIAASTMKRRDITQDSLSEGEWVRIVANPARNAARRFGNGVTIEKLDGTELLVSFESEEVDLLAAVPDLIAASSLEGTWRGETRLWRARPAAGSVACTTPLVFVAPPDSGRR